MRREFIMTADFDKSWREMNMRDDDLAELQGILLQNPLIGAVMKDTGGFRKVRFQLGGVGKRGGCRVIYIDFPIYETLFLLLAYPKSEKDDLSPEDRRELKKIADNIKKNLERKLRRL